MIFNMGAALFVVQDAFEIIRSVGRKMEWLTPKTTVLISSSSGGTERITFLAPFFKWFSNCSRLLNLPVHSTAISTLPQEIASTFISEENLTTLSPTVIWFFECEISFFKTPWILSYFKRWLKVFGSARSFTATTSIDGWSSNNLNRFRPIRPKPFMPTVIFLSIGEVSFLGEMFLGLVCGAHQWAAFYMPKAHIQAHGLILFEL